MAIIGIDLGTTNSLAVCYRNNKAEIIRNSLGEALTPSAVSIDENGEILVGQIAKERLISHPEKTASEFKRDMGLRKDIYLDGRAFSPEELSSLVLRKIKEDAESFLGEEVEEAVISVPAYFDDNCRSAAKLAAKLAGLKVERLVNEPSAAALAYQARHDFKDGTFMVIDFGGGTLDISIVDAYDSVIEILAVAGNNRLGGKDFNIAAAEYFCKENGLSYDALPAEEKAIVYKLAENSKIALTKTRVSMMSANIGGKECSAVLDNNKLIEISAAVFEKIAAPVRKALRDSKLSMDDIDEVILVGGSCRMPTVRSFIGKITGKTPCTDIDPDTAIAVGAGIFAGIKTRSDTLKDVVLTDICPFSLGVQCLDKNADKEVMSFIIERNSVLPSSREHVFGAASDGQTQIDIKIFQGESRFPSKNLFLGELKINVPPTRESDVICKVRMTYDINGILSVDVTTPADGKTYNKVILREGNSLSADEVQKCLENMEKLKISPSEKEENRLLVARAERLYEESFAEERDIIGVFLSKFEAALKSENNREIKQKYDALKELLDEMEGYETE